MSTVPTARSPVTYSSNGAFRITSDGVVGYSEYGVALSYGQSYIIRVRFTARIISVLYMKGAIKYEIYQRYECTRYSQN